MTQDSPVTLAAITGAHGVTGEVRLKLLGEGLDALKAHHSFNAGNDGGALTPLNIRSDGKGGAVARFAEVLSRADAEALRGTTLTVPHSTLPPLGEGEYYHADLIGLAVVTTAGEDVGKVIAVENFGATDVIEIAKPDGKTFMVPMTPQAVPEWNAERLVIASEFVEE